MPELLKIENISYMYDENILALKNVSAAFRAGERVAVLGGNGAGKSTFFLCCNGVLRPQTGKIYYNGREITKKKKDMHTLRKAIGLVFQDPDSQIIAGSVESEVSFGPMNLRLPNDEVSLRVQQTLSQMNISKYQNYAPQYLSGGEKKRVTIADILAMRPEMILFDEPTASLDPENVDVLENILEELSGAGITIVISTHDVNFAYRVAQRALVFAQGEIIADADIDEIFVSDKTLETAGLKKPLLYEAFAYLQNNLPGPAGGRHAKNPDAPNTLNRKNPKNIEEFKAYISDYFGE